MPAPRFLLHICCAPCSTHVLAALSARYAVTGYFYNPNIHPPGEHALRLSFAELHCRETGIPLVVPAYRPAKWFEAVRGAEKLPEGSERCALCIRLRLDAAARTAAELGFDLFGTTLTVSPHKNASVINQIGEEAGTKHGVPFHAADFKKADGFAASCRISRERGIYRQQYCGCIFSFRERRRQA